MPNKNPTDPIVSRLRSLFDAISDEVAKNPAFLARIEKILRYPEAIVTASARPSRSEKVPCINILEIIHRDGREAALQTLEGFTNDELVKLAIADGIKKGKEAKAMERKDLISLLIDTASARLRQGESFTKG